MSALNEQALIQRLLRLPRNKQKEVVDVMNNVLDMIEDEIKDDDQPPKPRKPRRGRTMQTTVELAIRRK